MDLYDGTHITLEAMKGADIKDWMEEQEVPQEVRDLLNGLNGMDLLTEVISAWKHDDNVPELPFPSKFHRNAFKRKADVLARGGWTRAQIRPRTGQLVPPTPMAPVPPIPNIVQDNSSSKKGGNVMTANVTVVNHYKRSKSGPPGTSTPFGQTQGARVGTLHPIDTQWPCEERRRNQSPGWITRDRSSSQRLEPKTSG